MSISNIQSRVIGKERSRPHQNGVAHGPQFMVPAGGSLPCNAQGGGNTPVIQHSHETVFRDGNLHFHKCSLIAYKIIVGFKEPFYFSKDYRAVVFRFIWSESHATFGRTAVAPAAFGMGPQTGVLALVHLDASGF